MRWMIARSPSDRPGGPAGAARAGAGRAVISRAAGLACTPCGRRASRGGAASTRCSSSTRTGARSPGRTPSAGAGSERELARAGRWLERGDGTRPEVALTFDDGPHPVFTPRLLDLLRDLGVPATFFCVGICAAAYPELVARTVQAGHLVGNHTWSHPYLPDLTRDEVLRQVDATGEVLRNATGAVPALVRPPYGSRTPEVLRWFAGQDLTTVLWDVDARDWAGPGTEAIVHTVTTSATAGSIVLMHDAGGDRTQTLAAVPRVVASLRKRGYRFVTVDRLSPPAP